MSLNNYIYRLREYAALSNSPIIYCLTYELETHRIAGIWAYEWLVNFVNTTNPVVFHPHSLKLIKDNLPFWKNPLSDVDDYQLFLKGAALGQSSSLWEAMVNLDNSIKVAIQENRVLLLDKNQSPWAWKFHNE